MLRFLVNDVIISKRGGCCNTLLRIQLADDCLDGYSQNGLLFVHIQLVVARAKKLLFIVQCNFVVKTVRTLNKLRSSKVVLLGYFFMLQAESI